MTRSARAAALRSTALATSLALAVGLSAFAVEAGRQAQGSIAEAAADRAQCGAPCRPQIPRQATAKPVAPVAPAAPAASPGARDPPARGIAAAAAQAVGAGRGRRDVVDLAGRYRSAGKRHRARAQAQARRCDAGAKPRSSDPVARKLAEWVILRSDDNGASVERYRAFISANPSWPSQTFLRRRLEAALWDDRRDDATVWAWFENESPLSAKGKFSLARAMIARGDRANAERLVRNAWRNDSMSEDTESAALDLFGALITPGDHKARMDLLLYGSEHDAALRAAKRLGANQVALAKARIAAYNARRPTPRRCWTAVPRELHGDPGYIFSKIQLLRREEKFAEAAQLMLSAPKDPGRLHNLDEWWIERRLLSRKCSTSANTAPPI